MKKITSDDKLWRELFQNQLPKPAPIVINLAGSSPYKAIYFYNKKLERKLSRPTTRDTFSDWEPGGRH